jgi:hypothetical protein
MDKDLRWARAARLTRDRCFACALLGALLGHTACGDDQTSASSASADSASTSGARVESDAEGGAPSDGSMETDGAGAMGRDPGDVTEQEEAGPVTEVPAASTPVDPLEMLLSEYRNWQPFTAEPINVSAEIFSLCRSPTLAENAFVDTEHGQHMLMDWLNPGARAGFEALGTRDFAPGSAIVKEKLDYRPNAEPLLVAIGIMLKHEPGFDPEHGDWEFGYWEEEPGLIDGPDQSAYCADCHASSPTDFVFLDDSWRDSSEVE